MNSEKFRDYTLAICAILFTLVFCVSNLYTTYTTWQYASTSPSPNEPSLSVYSTCNINNDSTQSLSIALDNSFSLKDVKDVQCTIIDTSGLTISQKSQMIGDIPKESSDICSFALTGTYTKPLKVEVKYSGKTVRQAVECYTTY